MEGGKKVLLFYLIVKNKNTLLETRKDCQQQGTKVLGVKSVVCLSYILCF